MATVWAKSNGNWATASIWAFWNETTQQIEDYGQYPQSGDIVYCNGYTITAGTLNVPTITLRNDYNAYTQRQGGYLTLTANVPYVFKDIYAEFDYIFNATYGTNIPSILVAVNIYVSGQGGLMRHTATSIPIYITANIHKTSSQSLITRANTNVHGNWQVVINGNIYAEGLIIGTYSSLNQEYSYITINGNVKVVGTRIILQATVSSTINGNINYSGIDIFFGVATTFSSMKLFVNGGIYRDDESGNGIMVTNYQLANTEQYPAEDEVKQGTEYVWGEKVGTYQAPPESVVLKDYVYDGGEMVGTLDLPQAPTTSDIVTAIKNDSDLGGKINTTNTNVGNISTAVTTIDGKVDIIDTNVDTLLSRLTSVLTQRLGQSVTVEILQQILVAHMDN